jgi:hypothetical protein
MLLERRLRVHTTAVAYVVLRMGVTMLARLAACRAVPRVMVERTRVVCVCGLGTCDRTVHGNWWFRMRRSRSERRRHGYGVSVPSPNETLMTLGSRLGGANRIEPLLELIGLSTRSSYLKEGL